MIPRRSQLPGRPLAELAEVKEAVKVLLGRQHPDSFTTMIVIERTGYPPSSVRRALASLVAEKSVERLERSLWRATRSSVATATSPTMRPGRPGRALGLRDLWLAARAREEGRNGR